MRFVIYIIVFVVGAFTGCSLHSSAYYTISVDEAARFLSERNIKVGKETTSDGAYIRAEMGGYPFKVQFYQCEGDKNCQSMMFTLGFTNVSRDFGSLERMNSWDAKFRTTKVYLDDKKPTLEMLVPIKEGVTTARLEDDIQTWSMLFPKFVEYMAGGNL